jgi:periplasmic divalent cation tolerance protein
MSGPVPALIWCPFPDSADAQAASHILLDEGLVACANILPPMLSLYQWQGERGQSCEVGVLFKSNDKLLDSAITRIAELHAYDAPAIVGWCCDAAAPATIGWLAGLLK